MLQQRVQELTAQLSLATASASVVQWETPTEGVDTMGTPSSVRQRRFSEEILTPTIAEERYEFTTRERKMREAREQEAWKRELEQDRTPDKEEPVNRELNFGELNGVDKVVTDSPSMERRNQKLQEKARKSLASAKGTVILVTESLTKMETKEMATSPLSHGEFHPCVVDCW